MEYIVSFVEQITKDGEVQGGDDHTIKEFKTKSSALKFGKKKSFQKTFNKGKIVHEVYIRAYDEEEDVNYVWFIKDGKITHHDAG